MTPITTTLRALLDEPKPVSIEAMEALLELDACGALVPHGLGGHGRECLASAVQQIKSLQTLLGLKTQFAELKDAPLDDPSIEPLVAKFQAIANDYDCDVRLTGDERDRIVVALLLSTAALLSAAEAAQSARTQGRDDAYEECAEYVGAIGREDIARMIRARKSKPAVSSLSIHGNCNKGECVECARNEALEEAAKVADGVGTDLRHGDTRLWHIGAGAAADKIASAIRALGKETGHG